MLGSKKGKKSRKIRERKNLLIANMGDTVVIKNRSLVGNAVLGALIMIFGIVVFFMLKEAWDVPLFWVIFIFLFVGTAYSFANTIFGRIVLRSKTMLMTVYSPFKREYQFEDINYVDLKSSKPSDGYITHSVIVYIGDGRKRIKIDTFSRSQADELVALLRGMLDNAAMEYPEGNEEPFHFDDEDKKQSGLFQGLFKKKAHENPDPSEPEESNEGENADYGFVDIKTTEEYAKCEDITEQAEPEDVEKVAEPEDAEKVAEPEDAEKVAEPEDAEKEAETEETSAEVVEKEVANQAITL